MTTNADFLTKKRADFIAYLRTFLTKANEEQLRQIECASVTDFMQYIVIEVSPYKSNIPAYLARILDAHQIKFTDLSPEQVKKLTLYIDCFIDIVSQGFVLFEQSFGYTFFLSRCT